MLPAGWKERLVSVRNSNTGGGVGLCLEVHDLAASKLVAGREKDLGFVGALLRHRMAQADLIQQRLAITELTPAQRELVLPRLEGLMGKAAAGQLDKN